MKKTLFHGFLATSLCLFSAVVPAVSQVLSSFENPADGSYSNGATVIGKTDASAGGSWTLQSGTSANIFSSNANPLEGSLAVRMVDSDASSGSLGAHLNLADAVVTAPFVFNFSMAIDSVSADTGSQVQIYFGDAAIGNGNHWLRLDYNDGNLRIFTGTPGGLDSAVTIGSYTTFSNLGDYVTFNLEIDPTTHAFTKAQIAGTISSLDFTSSVLASNDGRVPWNVSGGVDPGKMLTLAIGSNDTATVDFDVLQVVPEPGVASLALTGLFAMFWRVRTRRGAFHPGA